MYIYDFITQDELDDLPDDPTLAFMAFVRHAQDRLNQRLKEIENEENVWHLLEDARYGFQNVVIAAAKRFNIEPLATLKIPTRDAYEKNGNEYRQFRSDLDHYMTQIVIDNSIKKRQDSIDIAPYVKDKIRTYVHGLKTVIDQSNFTESKRAALLAKLVEFERELDKRRLNLLAVTRLAIEILAIPGGLWGSYEVATKLTNNILQAVGEAKATDDENRRLPPSEIPAALMPPRSSEPSKPNGLLEKLIAFEGVT